MIAVLKAPSRGDLMESGLTTSEGMDRHRYTSCMHPASGPDHGPPMCIVTMATEGHAGPRGPCSYCIIS